MSVDDNLVALKEYFDKLREADQTAIGAALVAAEKGVSAALASSEKAITKAETAADKRFDAVNEFRRTLADQTNTFLPRAEYNAQHKALEDKLNTLADRFNKTEGRSAGLDKGWAILVGLLASAATVVGIIMAFK